uniref:11-beta-hydroxysteroid dehydrogenase 1B n=1 Tax=Zea mays TaxID=4577 RepID=A0A804NLE2_MAIZE
MSSKDAVLNAFLSCFMHVGLALVLLVYLPAASVLRLLVRPLLANKQAEDLRGKVVLVTGASSGIGEHLVYEYARNGACVALVARTEVALRAVAKAARDLGSPDVLVVPADVTKVDDAKRAVDETLAHFGKLNHLVANAGIWSSCFFEEITNITAFHNVMDLNFWGAVYPTYFALPYLKASRGNIVVTASVAGRVPTARMSFYNIDHAYGIQTQIRFRIYLNNCAGKQRRRDTFLRDAKGRAGVARARHHPHARLRRLQPHQGQGPPEGRPRRRRRGGPRHQRGADAGGQDGVAGGGGGGERAARGLLRDVARLVLALPHGHVRRAGAARLVLPGLLRLQVRRPGRRRRAE